MTKGGVGGRGVSEFTTVGHRGEGGSKSDKNPVT